VAVLVAIAMTLVVTMGSLVGMMLPAILTRLRMDPATASVPLVTSAADIVGILIYFSLAVALLNLPTGAAL
jgi:magnesium transporter